MAGFIHNNFHPLITAFTTRPLPFTYRWRLLYLFPINLLTNIIIKAPYWFRRKPYETIYIPTRSGLRRALLYRPPLSTTTTDARTVRPLHISLHPGAFAGGLPESQTRLDIEVSRRTGAIVISPTYRFAPLHPFPAAIDDVDDIIAWLHTNAASRFGANPNIITTGGTSAGGNLALAACHAEGCSGGSQADTRIKGTYTCYAPIELRVPPWEKKTLCPEKFPKYDPMSLLLPVFDAYAALSGGMKGEARCSPMVMRTQDMPRDVLMVLAELDIVVDEGRRFVERVRAEIEEMGEGEGAAKEKRRNLELMDLDGVFHGWLELPKAILEKERVMVFDKIVGFLGRVHRRYGYHQEES